MPRAFDLLYFLNFEVFRFAANYNSVKCFYVLYDISHSKKTHEK